GADEVLRRLAVDALTAVLARSTGDATLLARRGHVLARLGRHEQARADYAEAARLQPKDDRWPIRQAQLGPGVLAFWSFDHDADGWQSNGPVTLAGSRLRLDLGDSAVYFTAAATAPAGWKEV